MAVRCLNEAHGERFAAYHGDCIDVISQLPAGSIDFSVYSPPFGNLFVYSDSEADMGNSSSDGEFAAHYAFLVREKLRVTKPGRLTAVHCSDLPLTKWKDGMIGIKDFSGQIIALHEEAGWVMHSRRTIHKNPVVEMTRTKHIGLLYKQLLADSARSRGGMPDYLITFVKPGENAEPIQHTVSEFPLEQWQEWASPVWMTVNQTKVLNVASARGPNDERHLCPLQLDVIDRALRLWSNPNDVVLSPFMGIGSEGYGALKAGRRFIGTELKEEYWRQATRHLTSAEQNAPTLFDQLMGDAA
jgi:DNA modification methylase